MDLQAGEPAKKEEKSDRNSLEKHTIAQNDKEEFLDEKDSSRDSKSSDNSDKSSKVRVCGRRVNLSI